jgi:CelD/BcsL family acetyltransferase involved in cellulose biosynthesis
MEQGGLLLKFLDIDKAPYACEYGFEYKKTFFLYQTGYCNHFPGNASIGFVLTSYIIEDAIASGIKEIHFLRGNGFHKDRWSRRKLVVHDIVIAKMSIKGLSYAAFHAAYSFLRKLGKIIILLKTRKLTLKNLKLLYA